MFGDKILARSLTVPTVKDKAGNIWQYHSRSDRHSRVACWGALFDVLRACALMRQHAQDQRIVFGINHEMTDFVTGKHKKLDLVVCQPRSSGGAAAPLDFASLANEYPVSLTSDEREALRSLPILRSGPVGDVLFALESKACMTAHTRAQPRFYDELASAAQCINGSAPGAIAVGYALVNVSPTFVSSDLNKSKMRRRKPKISADRQPVSWQRALTTVRRLTIRGHASDRGYDAIGVTMLQMANDGSPVTLAPIPPSLPPADSLNYERMILRISGLYDTRFQNR